LHDEEWRDEQKTDVMNIIIPSFLMT